MGEKKDVLPKVLARQNNWNALYFYQKSDVIYQLSFAFCDRFIDLYKDRTRDQIIQAARSCKQNIVEGLADGVTSMEMQLKLLNVARASLKELREDYEDISSRGISDSSSRETLAMKPCFNIAARITRWPTMSLFSSGGQTRRCATGALTLCHMIDHMMMTFLRRLEKDFVEEGGIKERMYRARTGYRQQQDLQLKQMQQELDQLKLALQKAQGEAMGWKDAYDDLKQRALNAYRAQELEIIRLREIINNR